MPAALEAGTLNGHGIAGLGAAVSYIERTGMDSIRGGSMKGYPAYRAWRYMEILKPTDARLSSPSISVTMILPRSAMNSARSMG